MSAAMHTPGPWLIAASGRTFVYSLNEQGYNRFWAHVQGGNTAPMESTTEDELAANARLIAASPSMLEALQQIAAIEDKLDGGDWDEIIEARHIARAAIAKATGEAS